MIREKSEKELLQEQLDGAIIDMVNYRKLEGQSPVIDANIRHKREQIERLRARIAEIEKEEADRKEREWQGMVAELEERTRQT